MAVEHVVQLVTEGGVCVSVVAHFIRSAFPVSFVAVDRGSGREREGGRGGELQPFHSEEEGLCVMSPCAF